MSSVSYINSLFFIFFFNDTATTEIYTLSLHDALPIYFPAAKPRIVRIASRISATLVGLRPMSRTDRKSTRLNSSHMSISYAVFCLKKKKKNKSYHFTFQTYLLGGFTLFTLHVLSLAAL